VAGIDTFCDIRARRGLRGPLYRFANAEYLQKRLTEMGIHYLHMKELAPSGDVRSMQDEADKTTGIPKRKRLVLSEHFVRSYEQERLAHFDAAQFLEQVGPEARTVALFCVEGHPEACHRSLLAAKLKQELGLEVEDIRPPQ
ncbi:MAG: DUF488 domain-containing protein, partial [Chloroflexota bacterium]|nr:DUF488 domain-containing protein [Chloroflexota bacterium]